MHVVLLITKEWNIFSFLFYVYITLVQNNRFLNQCARVKSKIVNKII